MNKKMVIYTTGLIVGVEGLCILLSAIVSLIYKEQSGIWLFIAGLIACALYLISVLFKPKDQTFFAKEGFVTVALSWLVMSIIGALPFYFSGISGCCGGQFTSFIDCFFETASGLTTTGASILTNVEIIPKGLLFWRSFTHWIGGMGVLVLVLAIAPVASGRSMHMARAEMPGPVIGKLVPKMKDTAKILYVIYFVLTLVLVLLLRLGGDMDWFESFVHAFGTAGTGGFGIKNDSIASYNLYTQWVLAIFMLVFTVNFNLYYLILIKKASTALKSRELWTMCGIVAVASIIIGINIYGESRSVGDTVTKSVFQVASIISTTGYTTASITNWPNLSKSILFILMFFGGCAGSTAGGIKISRVMLIVKQVHYRIKHTLHPRGVQTVKFEGKTVDEDTLNGATSYLAVYIICFLALFLVLSFEHFGIEDNLSAAASTFNNVGPAFGVAASSYEAYSGLSKIAMSFAMLLGRLEIYPLLIIFSPSTWNNN